METLKIKELDELNINYNYISYEEYDEGYYTQYYLYIDLKDCIKYDLFKITEPDYIICNLVAFFSSNYFEIKIRKN